MSVVINTNVDALKIQNILTSSSNKLSQTMQRMSSGLQINSAQDDAAGTVISARMDVQLGGNKICQKNVQNANSMLSTAEGNIDVVLDNISRIRDLTLQAKNGTYSTEEKKAMQDEVAQRINEIDRISDSSKFSQLKLFGDSSANSLLTAGATFQVGANSTDADTISIAKGVNDSGVDLGKSVFSSVKFVDLLSNDVDAVEGVDSTNVSGGLAAANIVDAKANATDSSKIYFVKADGKFYQGGADGKATEIKGNINFGESVTPTTKEKASCTANGDVYEADGKYYVTVNKDGETDEAKFKQIDAGYAYAAKVEAQEASRTKVYNTNADFDLQTMDNDGFVQAINQLDKAIDNLTARKSTIGSLGNRLSSALDTLTTQFNNLTSAKSIITDADIAAEASAYTQNQILQQVSTSLLAQANQAPSIALSLL